MERIFYVQLIPEVGYITTMCEQEPGFHSSSLICNFGAFLADAERFRDDCENGIVTEKQIKSMINEKYSDKPMEYLGNGRLKEQDI